MSTEHDAIAGLIADLDPGALVTRFVIVAEVLGIEGSRDVWVTSHDGSGAWDRLGLLHHALNLEAADQVAEVLAQREGE